MRGGRCEVLPAISWQTSLLLGTCRTYSRRTPHNGRVTRERRSSAYSTIRGRPEGGPPAKHRVEALRSARLTPKPPRVAEARSAALEGFWASQQPRRRGLPKHAPFCPARGLLGLRDYQAQGALPSRTSRFSSEASCPKHQTLVWRRCKSTPGNPGRCLSSGLPGVKTGPTVTHPRVRPIPALARAAGPPG